MKVPVDIALTATIALQILLDAARAAGGEPQAIVLHAPSGRLAGVPVLVRVEVLDAGGSIDRDLWDAQATLTAAPAGATVTPATVTLWNGVGSALVAVAGSGDVVLTASLGALEASRTLRSLAAEPVAAVSGNVPGPLTEWSGVIHVTGSVTVPAGVTLRLLPGTLVLVDGVQTGEIQPGDCQSVSATPTKCGKSITVRGALESMGREDEPVTITAFDPAKAWGEIHHDNASPSIYDFTSVTRAGNSPRGGHTNTGPAIRATNSRIRFDDCTLADTAGKAMQATGSSLEFHRCLLTRSKMGPEIDGTALNFDRSYALEMKGKPPLIDDNDGIYLHSQKAGQVISITSCVFANGDDDGIDTLGSNITVEDTIVRDWANPDEDSKGISVFSGEVALKKCLFARNKVAVSAKSQNGGSATVRMERTTVADSTLVGIQAEDKFGEPDLRIRYFVSTSIVRSPDAVKTDYPQFPGDIQIQFSDLSEPWTGAGNIAADPLFSDAARHDYRLRDGSPCIDSGEAGLPPDPDGTRADMGFHPFDQGGAGPSFVRGRVNGDADLDISDPVALLLHLFAGRGIACEDAADANDDGGLNTTDAVFLLDYLFRDGPPLPAPSAGCGPDSTDDALGCASPPCG